MMKYKIPEAEILTGERIMFQRQVQICSKMIKAKAEELV